MGDPMLTKCFESLQDKHLEFWVKWSASVMSLIHVYVTAHDLAPWYKLSGVVCAALWLWCGYLWKQSNLIVLNVIMVLIYLKGIFNL